VRQKVAEAERGCAARARVWIKQRIARKGLIEQGTDPRMNENETLRVVKFGLDPYLAEVA
jgi:hypothetical protein